MYCKACGNSVVKGARFCQHCGAKLDQILKKEIKSRRNNGVGFNITLIVITIVLTGISTSIILKTYSKESRVKETIRLGSRYLEEKNFHEAVSVFQEAVSMDAKNKSIYLDIKDAYMANSRPDDALYFIKLAMKNNVKDKEIKAAFDTIKQGFEVSNLEYTIYHKDSYSLPKEVPIRINGEEVNAEVKWNKDTVNTEQTGSFQYEGTAEQYERSIKLTLLIVPKVMAIKDIAASVVQGEEFVLPDKAEAEMSDSTIKAIQVKWNVDKINTKTVGVYNYEGAVEGYDKKLHLLLTVTAKTNENKQVTRTEKIGYIKKVYEKAGKRYLQIDEVQYLSGDAAIEAAKKAGAADYDETTKKYSVPNDYYIVNSNPRLRDYEIPNNTEISVLNILVSSEVESVANTPVPYSQFKYIINGSDAGDLCRIFIENNVVVKIEGQYVP
jgi:tetratricopeptide (TPR) repeat protein